MDDYLIYTDSAADIPAHYYQEYDIRIVPMEFSLNGETDEFHTESPDHDKVCDALYAAMRQGADVHTSQITEYKYIEEWTPQLKAGHDILYLAFSSGMSATWQNACMAAASLMENFPERTVRVIDSKAATCGQGVLAVTMAMNKAKGMNLKENGDWMDAHIRYICHRFTVGDLGYLHKGGRVSAGVALVGTMLNVKPLLIIDSEGKLQVVGKVRGEKAAIKALVKDTVSQLGAPDVPKVFFVGHTSKPEGAQKLKQMVLEACGPDTRVEVMCETPIIGVHTGPEFYCVCGWGMHQKVD